MINEKHVQFLSDQVRRLIEQNTADIIEAYENAGDDIREVKLSISASCTEIGGKHAIKSKISFHKSTIKDEENVLIDDRQLGLFDAIQAVEKMRPKKGSGIDSVTFETPGRDPVTLVAK